MTTEAEAKYYSAKRILEDNPKLFLSKEGLRNAKLLVGSENLDKYLKETKKPIPADARDYTPIHVKDFLSGTIEKEKPIIEKFIPEKSLNIHWGEPASYKSIEAVYVACCVSTGKRFLGKYKVRQKPVLFISTEMADELDKKRFKAIFKGMGISTKRRRKQNLPMEYQGRDKIDVLSNETFYSQLKDTIDKKKIGFLVIDTISPLLSDVNDNFAGEIVKMFKERLFPLIDDYGISILLTMHSQKSGKDFLGSVKLKASSDCFYEVLREEGESGIVSLLCHKGREGENNLRMKIDFIKKNNILDKIQLSFVGEFSGKQSPKSKQTTKLEQAKSIVIETLKDKELKWNELIEQCKSEGLTRITIARAIINLYENKKILKKKGKEGGYYLS